MDNAAIWKELGLDVPADDKQESKVVFQLKDPATGAVATFNSQEEMDLAVAGMYQRLSTGAQTPKETSKAEDKSAPQTPKKVTDTWTIEEKATFAALSEEDPVRAADFLFQRTDTAKRLKEEAESARRESEALKQNIAMAQFIQAKPELSTANPNRGAAWQLLGSILQQSGINNPNAMQMEMAVNYARNIKPELFNLEQPKPQFDQWGIPVEAPMQFNQPQQPQQAQRPSNPPVPPRSGGSGYASPSDLQLLNAAYEKGGQDAADRAWATILGKYTG